MPVPRMASPMLAMSWTVISTQCSLRTSSASFLSPSCLSKVCALHMISVYISLSYSRPTRFGAAPVPLGEHVETIYPKQKKIAEGWGTQKLRNQTSKRATQVMSSISDRLPVGNRTPVEACTVQPKPPCTHSPGPSCAKWSTRLSE
jgi:hypothetical protein